MLVKCRVLESFSGLNGSFRTNAEVTFPYEIAQSYSKYGLVKILEVKDEPEKPTAKFIKTENEEGEKEARAPKVKRKYVARKTKTARTAKTAKK